MKRKNKVISNLKARHLRIRKNLSGTSDRPRLCLTRHLNHLEAQLVNDSEHKTLLSLSTKNKDFKQKIVAGGNTEAAKKLGAEFAGHAKTKGFSKVVFDRGGRLYHGRIKAFAEAARESGLQF